jgi:hypothetical protein
MSAFRSRPYGHRVMGLFDWFALFILPSLAMSGLASLLNFLPDPISGVSAFLVAPIFLAPLTLPLAFAVVWLALSWGVAGWASSLLIGAATSGLLSLLSGWVFAAETWGAAQAPTLLGAIYGMAFWTVLRLIRPRALQLPTGRAD